MKLNYKLFTIFISLFALQGILNISKADDHLHTVSGSITGCSTKHSVHVLIYEESGFNDGMNHSQEIIIDPSKNGDCSVPFSFNKPTGSYALASFEDKNNNGKLDFFFFIPKEPAGFYKFSGMGAPKFDKMKIDVNEDINGIEIVLP